MKDSEIHRNNISEKKDQTIFESCSHAKLKIVYFEVNVQKKPLIEIHHLLCENHADLSQLDSLALKNKVLEVNHWVKQNKIILLRKREYTFSVADSGPRDRCSDSVRTVCSGISIRLKIVRGQRCERI